MADFQINFKRVYDTPEAADGARILCDRLWPRGIKKDALQLAQWCRDACPSHSLRKNYHAATIDFKQFARAYLDELASQPEALLPIMVCARQGPVTLLSAVKAFENSHLPVLKHAVLTMLEQEDREADGQAFSSPVCFGADFNYWG